MMIGTLAITGVGIPLTHYRLCGLPCPRMQSSRAPLRARQGGYAFWMLVIAALFTVFYSWRLMFMTFFGKPRGDKHTHDHAHESPLSMLVPLGVLSLGAIFSGMVWYNSFFGDTDTVGKFFGVPYAEARGSMVDDHAPAAKAAEDGSRR